jgi:hypothetical protein
MDWRRKLADDRMDKGLFDSAAFQSDAMAHL